MISLKNVSFSYDGQENNGLHNVSLEIPKVFCCAGKAAVERLQLHA